MPVHKINFSKALSSFAHLRGKHWRISPKAALNPNRKGTSLSMLVKKSIGFSAD
jgi:hypothetical protein